MTTSDEPSSNGNNRKIPQVRIRNEAGYRLRGEAICVRNEKEDEVLLISRADGGWSMPGGGVEKYEDASMAAVREVDEEAGVRGHIVRQLGVFKNDRRLSLTTVFILQVDELLNDWVEKSHRDRKWFSIKDALLIPNFQNTYRNECLQLTKAYISLSLA